jgi:hypothetical protein
MAIINILYKTAVLFACSMLQVFGVLIEGAAKLFDKFGEYLEILHDKLVDKADIEMKRKKHKFEAPR